MSYTIFTATSVSQRGPEQLEDVSLSLTGSRFGQICIAIRETPYITYAIFPVTSAGFTTYEDLEQPFVFSLMFTFILPEVNSDKR